MDNYYVLVIGNGRTSRANTDALMEDYYYANGKNGTLVLAFEGRPSEGQIYAAQLAKDKNIDIVVFNTKLDAPGLPACSVIENDNPVAGAVDHIKGKKSAVFFLWDGSDSDALNQCLEANIPAFDLTEGLNSLNAVEAPKSEAHTPTVKELEDLFSAPVIPSTESSEPDLEDKILEIVSKHLLTLSAVITEEVVALIHASKTPSKGA